MEEFFASLASSAADASLSLGGLVLPLVLSLVLSLPLAWVYARTHQGVSYSRSFTQGLVLMSFLVTLVMLAIGDSMARAFGLFGALALIRFRTPIKDTRDTVFLFLSVGIGIAVGTRSFLLGVVGTALALLVIYYLHWTHFGEVQRADGVLRFRMPLAADGEEVLQRLLGQHCRRFALVQVREGVVENELEYAYELELRNEGRGGSLVAELRTLVGAGDVHLLLQADREEI